MEEPEAGDDINNDNDDTISSGSEEWSQEDQAPLSSMKKPNQSTDKVDDIEEASTAEKQGPVKRKREETSQSDEEEDEEQDNDDQDFERYRAV